LHALQRREIPKNHGPKFENISTNKCETIHSSLKDVLRLDKQKNGWRFWTFFQNNKKTEKYWKIVTC
jgi:hypothetical protein